MDTEIYFIVVFAMASLRKCCVLNPGCFCYICVEYIYSKYRKLITDFVISNISK